MKILIEKKLLSNQAINNIAKLNGSARAEQIVNSLEDVFPTKFHNIILANGNQDNSLLQPLLDSIDKYGWDDSGNKSLLLIQKLNTSIPKECFSILSNALQEGTIKKIPSWLNNSSLYNIPYRIKALIFLESGNAEKYGIDSKLAKEEIMEMNSESKIKSYLSNLQTKNPLDGEEESNLTIKEYFIQWLLHNAKKQISKSDISKWDRDNNSEEYVKAFKNYYLPKMKVYIRADDKTKKAILDNIDDNKNYLIKTLFKKEVPGEEEFKESIYKWIYDWVS